MSFSLVKSCFNRISTPESTRRLTPSFLLGSKLMAIVGAMLLTFSTPLGQDLMESASTRVEQKIDHLRAAENAQYRYRTDLARWMVP